MNVVRAYPLIGVSAGLTLLACGVAAQTDVTVPSGAELSLYEARFDGMTQPASMRFRYVQENLTADTEYDVLSQDLLALCQTHAVPNLGENGAEIGQIIVSIANEGFEFGETRPDVIQFFEIFAYSDGQCTWAEVFE